MSDVQSPDAPEPAVLPLLGPAEIRELAASAGIRPTKTLGQNFVIDPNTIRRIVAAAQLHRGQDDDGAAAQRGHTASHGGNGNGNGNGG